ncbi:MAG: hypothetical protein KKA10_14560 [Euryarchaeota archaeon]|nr:hypothetical protein [Euryarchaeota archaeon]MCG2735148.1 hypothetical protein [Candidatus Methanoperedenaceae archaeon]
MNKLNLMFLLVFLVSLTQVASAQSYLVTETAPVYPGDTNFVYVPIKNIELRSFMEDVNVRLVPKDNASANAVKLLDDVDSLGTINDWGSQRTAKFRIHVNPDAVEGDYYFNVYITYMGQQTSGGTQTTATTTKLEDQILTIKGRPVIVLLSSTIGTISPMSTNKETLRFKNTGTGTVQNAVASIDLSGTNVNSIFSIIGGGTQFSLGNLKAGDEASITFDLAVDIAARPGVYNLPIKITGLNNYSSNNYVGLIVAGTTDFEISYQETLGSVSINVANVGISSASAVKVSLPRQKNFSSTGSSSSVLGNLNSGDYTSAIFQITKNAGAGNSLELEIQYTDTSGQRHTITKSLPVELSQAGAQNKSASTNYTIWLLAAIVILVIYWQREKIAAYFQKSK